MIFNAILMKVLSLQPYTLFWGLMVFALVLGLAAALLPALVITLLEQTRKARAIRKGAITEEAQAEIARWKLRALEAENTNKALIAWKRRATGLLEEARNHNRNQNADAVNLLRTGS